MEKRYDMDNDSGHGSNKREINVTIIHSTELKINVTELLANVTILLSLTERVLASRAHCKYYVYD